VINGSLFLVSSTVAEDVVVELLEEDNAGLTARVGKNVGVGVGVKVSVVVVEEVLSDEDSSVVVVEELLLDEDSSVVVVEELLLDEDSSVVVVEELLLDEDSSVVVVEELLLDEDTTGSPQAYVTPSISIEDEQVRSKLLFETSLNIKSK
jgi:hypothetical protein